MASRSFSRALLALVPLCALLAGCVTVRAEEKEFLADPTMTFTDRASELAVEEHILDNREGSFGGSTAGGGGCGCN